MPLTNIIKIEDLNNRSLDDIITLYRSGYVLEDTKFQSSIQQLQLPSLSTSIVVLSAGALSGLVLMLILRRKPKKK